MFPRTPKSSAVGPALDLLPGAGAHDPSDLRAEHLQEWRRATKRVTRSYKAWCSANRRDRQDLYLSFLDALGREELAARQVERDASGLGAAEAGP